MEIAVKKDQSKSNPVLVTGGAGYIGSHVVYELLEQHYPVVVIDDLSLGHLQAIPRDAVFIQGSVSDRALVEQLFHRYHFQAVIHFAARSIVGESMEKPFMYLRENVIAALTLIEQAATSNVKKFVFSSTASLFGSPEKIPIDEEAAINPGSPYGESKNIIERILLWADRIFGMKYANLRYFNAAGADPQCRTGEDHNPETHLIPLVLKTALGQRDHVVIFGDDYPTPDGTCLRDYIHVTDLARAHILALRVLDEKSVCYNLGNGTNYSVKQVIETAKRVTGKDIPVVMGPQRSGDPAVLVARSQKIIDELHWKAEFSDLETIIQTAWKWHSMHPNGFE